MFKAISCKVPGLWVPLSPISWGCGFHALLDFRPGKVWGAGFRVDGLELGFTLCHHEDLDVETRAPKHSHAVSVGP